MLTIYGQDRKDELVNTILTRVWNACREQSDSKHRDAVWQATALLIHNSEFNRNLLHAIAWSQVSFIENIHLLWSMIKLIAGWIIQRRSGEDRSRMLAVADNLKTRAGNEILARNGFGLEMYYTQETWTVFGYASSNESFGSLWRYNLLFLFHKIY